MTSPATVYGNRNDRALLDGGSKRGACNAPKSLSLPFRYRLLVRRRIPLISVPPDSSGGFDPPALGVN